MTEDTTLDAYADRIAAMIEEENFELGYVLILSRYPVGGEIETTYRNTDETHPEIALCLLADAIQVYSDILIDVSGMNEAELTDEEAGKCAIDAEVENETEN